MGRKKTISCHFLISSMPLTGQNAIKLGTFEKAGESGISFSKPLSILLGRFEFFRKFSEIFAAQGAPPVSLTPVAKKKPLVLYVGATHLLTFIGNYIVGTV
jgi:hypothetical protein